MFGFVRALFQLLRAIASSLKGTLSYLFIALRTRNGSKLVALLKEGSPLESLLDSTLALVFWVLILAPLMLLPVIYLLMSFMR